MKAARNNVGHSWFVVHGSLRHGHPAGSTTSSEQRTTNKNRRTVFAFTLIELMVVVGIIALVLTISIPSIYRKLHPDSITKAVDDVMEACRYARGRAILEGTVTELVFRPADRTIEVVPTGATGREMVDAAGKSEVFSPSDSGEVWRMEDRAPGSGGGGGSIFTVKLSDRVVIEGLGIHGLNYSDDEVSRVRFYPNGTSDMMELNLLSDRNERRMITLEAVTALADFEVDPSKFIKDR